MVETELSVNVETQIKFSYDYRANLLKCSKY